MRYKKLHQGFAVSMKRFINGLYREKKYQILMSHDTLQPLFQYSLANKVLESVLRLAPNSGDHDDPLGCT